MISETPTHRTAVHEQVVEGFGTVRVVPVHPRADLDVIHTWVGQERARFWGMREASRERVLEISPVDLHVNTLGGETLPGPAIEAGGIRNEEVVIRGGARNAVDRQGRSPDQAVGDLKSFQDCGDPGEEGHPIRSFMHLDGRRLACRRR